MLEVDGLDASTQQYLVRGELINNIHIGIQLKYEVDPRLVCCQYSWLLVYRLWFLTHLRG